MENQEFILKMHDLNKKQAAINKKLVTLGETHLEKLRSTNQDVYVEMHNRIDKPLSAEETNKLIAGFSELHDDYSNFLQAYVNYVDDTTEITKQNTQVLLKEMKKLEE